jgi:hypothetical protein
MTGARTRGRIVLHCGLDGSENEYKTRYESTLPCHLAEVHFPIDPALLRFGQMASTKDPTVLCGVRFPIPALICINMYIK